MTDLAAEIYDTRTGVCLRRYPISKTVDGYTLSGDGRRVAFTESPDRRACVCRVRDVASDMELVEVTPCHHRDIQVLLSPDGETLVTTGERHANRVFESLPDETSQFWSVKTGAELARIEGRVRAFSPDSKHAVLSVPREDGIGIVETRTGEVVSRIPGVVAGEPRLAFSPDGKTLAVCDGPVSRYDVASGKKLGTTPRPKGLPKIYMRILAYAAPDQLTVAETDGHADWTWDGLNGELVTPPQAGYASDVAATAYTPDGKTIVTVGAWGDCRHWDAATGAARPGPPEWFTGSVLSGDGSRVIAKGHVYDTTTCAVIADLKSTGLDRTWFLDDAGTLAVAEKEAHEPHYDQEFSVIRVDSGLEVCRLRLPRSGGNVALRPIPGRQEIVVAYNLQRNGKSLVEVARFDARTGKRLQTMNAEWPEAVIGFAVLDAQRVVVAAGARVGVFDLIAGRIATEFARPGRRECFAVAASPDGLCVAVLELMKAGDYWALRAGLYDAATGRDRGAINLDGIGTSPQPDAPRFLVFSPDGTRLATPTLWTTVTIWDVARFK